MRQTAARIGPLAGRVVPARLRIPVMAGLGVVAAVFAVHFARGKRPDFPSPIIVSITQSNAPLRIFPGGQGVFVVLPDGALWRWGETGTAQTPPDAIPELVDINRNWLKAAGDGAFWLGLRADGTTWDWNQRDESGGAEPRLSRLQLGGYSRSAVGRIEKRRNSLDLEAPRPRARVESIGTASNWTAIASRNNRSYTGLKADGTLWAWGYIGGTRNGLYWVNTNATEPILLCADTNWTSLDANGQARNRAGELWDASFSLPDPERHRRHRMPANQFRLGRRSN